MMEKQEKKNKQQLSIKPDYTKKKKKKTFLFNSAAVAVTSTLYPSYLIAFS